MLFAESDHEDLTTITDPNGWQSDTSGGCIFESLPRKVVMNVRLCMVVRELIMMYT